MSSRIAQPVGQQPHNNVAVVRYKSKGKKFEIACYKNMVLSYRSGNEMNLSNVLQIDRIFTNVSHGKFASQQEIASAFGPIESDEVIKTILLKGELQVAELERSAEHEKIWNSIAEFTSENCVNPVTKRKYSIPIIDKAMHAVGFSVRHDWSWKRQALLLIKKLVKEQPMPITRAQIKVKVTSSSGISSILPDKHYEVVESESRESSVIETVLIDAAALHDLHTMQDSHGFSLCMLETAVTAEGDGDISEMHLESKTVKIHDPKSVDERQGPQSMCGFLSNRSIDEKKVHTQKVQRKNQPVDTPIAVATQSKKKQEKRLARKAKQAGDFSEPNTQEDTNGELQNLLAQLDARLS